MFGKRNRERSERRPRRKRQIAPAPPDESKGLDAVHVIDQIRQGPNGETQLVIVHSRPWAADDTKQLRRKIHSYLAYMEQGQIDEANREWFQAEVLINLAHMDPIPDDFLSVVEAIGKTLVDRHGVGFVTTTFVDGAAVHAIERAGPSGTTAESAMRGGAAFTMYVASRLAAAGAKGLQLTGPLALMTEGQVISTERIWGECKAQGANALAAKVGQWVENVAGEAPVPEHQAILVPLIRPRSITELSADSLPLGTDPAQARFDLFTSFCGPLVICYALDLGSRFEYVPKSDRLVDLGLTPDDLPAAAVQNLRSALPEVKPLQAEGTCIGIAAGGDYEASLLLLDDFCDDIAQQVAGELIASIPSRDLLFLAGSEDKAQLADLRRRVEAAETAPSNQLWSGLMVWRGGRWQEWGI